MRRKFMAIHLSKQQFTYLCKQYNDQDFGFVYFKSIRELLRFILQIYQDHSNQLEERILELYDHNKDLSNLALEDVSVQVLRVEKEWIYIYQRNDFDIYEAMKETWLSFKCHAENYFVEDL